MPSKSVAIACQGGGSHTAFTAGVLTAMLEDHQALKDEGIEIRAISGTSGGAVCALLAWVGLADEKALAGAERLKAFWRENAATLPWDWAWNQWAAWLGLWSAAGFTFGVSPYAWPQQARDRLAALIGAQVAFSEVDRLAQKEKDPVLLVSAVEILTGRFEVFKAGGKRRDGHADLEPITLEAILASAAIPPLFRAERIEDRRYWDGLFSQNPPVRELIDVEPDELWLIKVNPWKRAEEPTSLAAIEDRRNELAGNIALMHELRFVNKINQLLGSRKTAKLAGKRYKQIVVRCIDMDDEFSKDFDLASKYDRSPGHLDKLMAHGRERGGEFVHDTAAREKAIWAPP
jgi:NTE family protein